MVPSPFLRQTVPETAARRFSGRFRVAGGAERARGSAARRPAAGTKARSGGGGAGKKNAWLAADGSKRWGEAFFLLYTPFWLTLSLGIVVPFKLYERFTEMEYLIVGLVSTVPAFLMPLFLVGKNAVVQYRKVVAHKVFNSPLNKTVDTSTCAKSPKKAKKKK